MNRFAQPTAAINTEVTDLSGRIDERQVDALITAIQTASRIALYGVSLFELAMFYFGELLVLEILKQTGRAIGEARDRHTNLE
jgi:hypothetical protein